MLQHSKEEYEAMVKTLMENHVFRVRNIQLTKCYLLSQERKWYPSKRTWTGLIQGVSFIEKIKDVHLNAIDDIYEIWGCIRKDGACYDTFLLLSATQATALTTAMESTDAPITITIPPYTDTETRALDIAFKCSGKHFEEHFGSDPNIQALLSHPYLFDLLG
ncbi:MAG: hypothetical protein Q4F30_07285 [Akkermansia sp.]|nr:hypothetical protein [Akkermansia sp.]